MSVQGPLCLALTGSASSSGLGRASGQSRLHESWGHRGHSLTRPVARPGLDERTQLAVRPPPGTSCRLPASPVGPATPWPPPRAMNVDGWEFRSQLLPRGLRPEDTRVSKNAILLVQDPLCVAKIWNVLEKRCPC